MDKLEKGDIKNDFNLNESIPAAIKRMEKEVDDGNISNWERPIANELNKSLKNLGIKEREGIRYNHDDWSKMIDFKGGPERHTIIKGSEKIIEKNEY